MALRKNFVTEHGFECPELYLVMTKVEYIKGDNAQATLTAYKDQASRNALALPILSTNFSFHYDYASELNMVSQAYMAIKSSPNFSDCEDV